MRLNRKFRFRQAKALATTRQITITSTVSANIRWEERGVLCGDKLSPLGTAFTRDLRGVVVTALGLVISTAGLVTVFVTDVGADVGAGIDVDTDSGSPSTTSGTGTLGTKTSPVSEELVVAGSAVGELAVVGLSSEEPVGKLAGGLSA